MNYIFDKKTRELPAGDEPVVKWQPRTVVLSDGEADNFIRVLGKGGQVINRGVYAVLKEREQRHLVMVCGVSNQNNGWSRGEIHFLADDQRTDFLVKTVRERDIRERDSFLDRWMDSFEHKLAKTVNPEERWALVRDREKRLPALVNLAEVGVGDFSITLRGAGADVPERVGELSPLRMLPNLAAKVAVRVVQAVTGMKALPTGEVFLPRVIRGK